MMSPKAEVLQQLRQPALRCRVLEQPGAAGKSSTSAGCSPFPQDTIAAMTASTTQDEERAGEARGVQGRAARAWQGKVSSESSGNPYAVIRRHDLHEALKSSDEVRGAAPFPSEADLFGQRRGQGGGGGCEGMR